MYNIIEDMISHTWSTGTNEQSYIYNICGALIILFTVVFLDMIYRIFRHFWRG